MTRIGILGGSGLYDIPGLTDAKPVPVETPFGAPSDTPIVGRLGDVELVFIPRHGKGHRFTPSEVPYRANLFAMKALGVEWVISASAVGSLKEDVAPGDVVIIDQFIDRTVGRARTFFGDGIVAHVAFGDPVCGTLRQVLLESCAEVGGTKVVDGGTYVCIEGPQFSTRAESELFRSWSATVVGMTNLPEARLAREAGMSYATMALVTDFDCWHPGHDDVTVEAVIATVKKNVAFARKVIAIAAPKIGALGIPTPQAHAMKGAIMTAPELFPADRAKALAILLENA